ncbi:MAG: ATP-binding cassette domain-containing protein [Desulfobacula sp.]|nr:ATP-binding cassette domain-containing protein [Desulfobacula sp.]
MSGLQGRISSLKMGINIINARTGTLFIDRFSARPGEAWCIFGAIHSGIHEFFRLVTGDMPGISAEVLELPEGPGIVSFKKQQAVYESELKKDDTDYMDRVDTGTPARNFILDAEGHSSLVEAFHLTKCLDQGFRELSTGQVRKLMLLSEFSKHPSCLIVETPFEGLDPLSCRGVSEALNHLRKTGVMLLLFVCNRSDIPSWCTHIGVMTQGSIVFQGHRETGIQWLAHAPEQEAPDFQASLKDLQKYETRKFSKFEQAPLVRLNQGSAGYGGKTIFQGLNLSITQGQHTLVTGPNGSGKSTLLQLITGDHPACYRNDLTLFGIKRGSGESIWDLKKDMGIVGSELHRNYHVPGSTLNAVLSGYFDSIGVYRQASPGQTAEAMAWLERINMREKARTSFRDLDFADQRLVLIARALIKLPRLLILDEPTQGLDESNRKAVLDFIETIAGENICTILYVSHREDEFRDFFIQHIRMG